MSYYYNKMVNMPFENAKAKVTEALKTEGFGIVSEIDMQSKFKEKLGVDFKKYTILGACNPNFAYQAVQVEENIGVMLPCNVVLIDQGNSTTEVAIIDPVASMMAIENKELKPLAKEAAERLKNVLSII